MVDSYDLTKLDTNTFEHLVNALALEVLGAGHTTFGPGKDGGRDGFFEGTAPYPSAAEHWSGRWYIQSKYHKPHLSKNSQQWLVEQTKAELAEFQKPNTARVWPDVWILATNIDPSGVPETGAFDRCRALVAKANPSLAKRFAIWGGSKVLTLLDQHPKIGRRYAHLITAGELVATLTEQLRDASASFDEVLRTLVVTAFDEQQFTKLEQAGSDDDNRPGIEEVFTDLPFSSFLQDRRPGALSELCAALALQREGAFTPATPTTSWNEWSNDPRRARTWLVKGGPGQGKSTLTQYVSQIQRAALILGSDAFPVTPIQSARAERIKELATESGYWPLSPRVPLYIELKEYAKWFGEQAGSKRLLSYIAWHLTRQTSNTVLTGTLNRCFGAGRWLVVLDGLDEVPGDVKDLISREIVHFINDFLVGRRADAQIVCTSRPQGYSGQLDELGAAGITLVKLEAHEALACAKPVLVINRSQSEAEKDQKTLQTAINSPAVREIMTTPLQSHIMAVVVRGGGRPPERRWQLFDNFYRVIKRREANRDLADVRVATILQEGDQLLRALHARIGFELHYRAERSNGATTSLSRPELLLIVSEVVNGLLDRDVDETIAAVMEATTDRLVLVNTPDNGENVRFDIRPLQEFFASEHIHGSGDDADFAERISTIAGDAHWREVLHFIFSALVELGKKTELYAAISIAAQLDGPGQEDGLRSLARRLARGAAIAARLINEGVLEQDKRVRQRFAIVLEALWGCTDAGFLLPSVTAPHSRDWLCTAALAQLAEKAEPEHIGASILLFRNLLDDDAQLEVWSRFVPSMSANYLGTLLAITSDWTFRASTTQGLPLWHADFADGCLRRADWKDLGSDGIFRALDIIFGDQTDRVVGSVPSGLDQELYSLLLALVRPPGRATRGETKILFGHVHLARAARTIEEIAGQWTDEKVDLITSYGGYYQLVGKSMSAVRSIAAGRQLLPAEITSLSEDRQYVPQELGPALFGPGAPYVSRNFADSSELSTLSGSTWAFSGIERAGKGEGDSVSLLRFFPELGFYLLGRGGADLALASRLLQDEAGQAALRDALADSDLSLFSLDTVGTLVKTNLLSDELRAASVCALGRKEPGSFYSTEAHPFPIDIPQEADALPHLVARLSEADFAAGRSNRGEQETSEEYIARMLRGYIPEPQALWNFAEESTCERLVGAALTLLLFHGSCKHRHVEIISSLRGLVNSIGNAWFVKGVAYSVSRCLREYRNEADSLMADLLAAQAPDLRGRYSVHSELRSWRESESAPVHTLGKPDLWRF